jgi:hypothetical protein
MFKNDPNANKDIDVMKMKMAIKKGYRIIRLLQEDVLRNDDAWLDRYIKPLLETGDDVEYICPDTPGIYNDHKRKFASISE